MKVFIIGKYYLLCENKTQFPRSYRKEYVTGKCIRLTPPGGLVQVNDKSFKGHDAGCNDDLRDKWYFHFEDIVRELTPDECMVEEL